MAPLTGVSHPGAGAAITVCLDRKHSWVWGCDVGQAWDAACTGGFGEHQGGLEVKLAAVVPGEGVLPFWWDPGCSAIDAGCAGRGCGH